MRLFQAIVRVLRNIFPPGPCPCCDSFAWDRETGAGAWWDCTNCGAVYNPTTGRWRAHLGVTWWR